MELTDKHTLTRKQLYDLVWSESLLSLSRKYNISDVGLRKICIRMSIPLPRAGHWEKLKHGRPVSIAPLPSSYSGKSAVTLTIRNENNISTIANKNLSVSTAIKEIKSNPELQLIVPDRLTAPDKLVASAKESLSRKEAKFGLYNGVVSSARGELTIRVAPHNVSRALRIMDTLIKALRSRKHTIEIENESTYAVIDSQRIKISLKEKLKRIIINNPKWSWESSEYQPTGILTFRIEGQTEWKDGKELLEAQLPKILAHLEVEAEQRKQRQEEMERFWEQQREKERIRRELEERKEKDLADFKETLQKATRWHKATNLRNYIDAVERQALAGNDISEELKEWLAWARKKADWYDPFTECEDELLNDVDIESLTFKSKKGYSS